MQLKFIKMAAAFCLFLIIIIVNSCENNSVVPANVPMDCDTTNLTYTNGMQILITINCGTMNTACHSSGTNRDFTTYSSLQKYVVGGQSSRFWQQIFILKKMPLYPELPLDLCASTQFKIWLLNGVPE
jgi:hypothetical protein